MHRMSRSTYKTLSLLSEYISCTYSVQSVHGKLRTLHHPQDMFWVALWTFTLGNSKLMVGHTFGGLVHLFF